MVNNLNDIFGWFDWASFYDKVVSEASDGDQFIEIGIYHGKSTIYLANQIKESNKDIKVIGIDAFLKDFFYGNYTPDSTRANFKRFEVEKYITLVENYSLKVSNNFKDESMFMIMLDGDHSYNAVYNELIAYYPKVKPGGYICGHDSTNVEKNQLFLMPVFHAVNDFCKKYKLDYNVFFNTSRENIGNGFFYIKKI